MHSRVTTLNVACWLFISGVCLCCSSSSRSKQGGYSVRPSSLKINSNVSEQQRTDTFSEVGIASYYNSKFHGKPTASGERYDMYAYTAAHRTLPFNTKVKVINLSTNASVVVRINDRGPVKKERIIDLSKNAAEKIGLLKVGIAKVRLEIQ